MAVAGGYPTTTPIDRGRHHTLAADPIKRRLSVRVPEVGGAAEGGNRRRPRASRLLSPALAANLNQRSGARVVSIAEISVAAASEGTDAAPQPTPTTAFGWKEIVVDMGQRPDARVVAKSPLPGN